MKLGATHHLEEDPPSCPVCGLLLNGATGVDDAANDAPPDPGDVTICATCFTFLEFDEERQVVELSEDAIAELPDDIRMSLLQLRKVLKQVDERRRRGGR